MLECDYFNKKEIDFNELVKGIDPHDTIVIARKLNCSSYWVKKYLSKEKKHANVRIPQLLIDTIGDIKAARKVSVESANAKIKNL